MKRFAVLFFLFVSISACRASSRLDNILADSFTSNSSVSLSVFDVATGREIYSFDADRSLVPASTMKLVTSYLALETLGPWFRFTTKLYIDSAGSVLIVGSGDPSLGVRGDELQKTWTRALKKSGVKMIRDIIGITGYLDDIAVSRYALWEDIGNYYGAVTSGLAWHRNEYTIYLRSPAQQGGLCEFLGTNPEDTGIRNFDVRIRAGAPGSGDQGYVFGEPASKRRILTGTIPPGKKRFAIRGSLPDPGFTCAACLRRELLKNSVAVTGRARSVPRAESLDSRARLVCTHISEPLVHLLTFMNRHSNNVYAEQLLKVVGRRKRGKGSRKAGIAALRDLLTEHSLLCPGLQFKDGSGLSRYNALTTRFLARLLTRAKTQLEASLPVAGKSCMLAGRITERALFGRLKAKTGQMEQVYALAGYLETYSGRKLSFSFIVNNGVINSYQACREFQKAAILLLNQ